MAAAAAAALVIPIAGATQVPWAGSPDQPGGATLAHETSDHGQSRGDEDRSGDSEKSGNEDSYDGSEFQGDDESSSSNDETLVDVDALNTPDE
jgi:hypothetical protein